jgi:hypothetical protein
VHQNTSPDRSTVAGSTLDGGRWSGGCPSRDISSMSVACCSRCCLLRMHVFRNCRLHAGPIGLLTASAFIPIGNCRSALFTTPASPPLPLHGARVRHKALHPRQQSPLPSRGSTRYLRNCQCPMPISCNYLIQKSDSRSSNASAKWRRDTHRHLCCWLRGNSVGLRIGEAPYVSTNRKNRVLRLPDLNLRRSAQSRPRRAQLSIRLGDRNYDRSIAGPGAGNAQRYLASDFDQLSGRLFEAHGIAAEFPEDQLGIKPQPSRR